MYIRNIDAHTPDPSNRDPYFLLPASYCNTLHNTALMVKHTATHPPPSPPTNCNYNTLHLVVSHLGTSHYHPLHSTCNAPQHAETHYNALIILCKNT